MADWYYAENDAQRGPVPREKLVELIAAGRVGPADLVWTDSMADWMPAAQVPGLMPAGSGGARRSQYEAAAPRGGWEGLSQGTKVSILIGVGGGVLAILVVALLVMLAPADKPPVAATESEKSDESAKTTTSNAPPVKQAPPAQEVLKHLAFDPTMIKTPGQKEAYELGVTQGKKIAEREAKNLSKDATKEQTLETVKSWLKERDTSIQVMVQKEGADSRKAMTAFGWRDGMKAWLKEHNMPIPEEK